MSVASPPTAEGDLTGTPFAHLVVYALERKLSGTLLLEETPERIHTLTFHGGAPSKCRPGDDYEPLGKLLVDEGLIEQTVLEAALSTHGLLNQGGLLGDMLVMAGHIEPEALDRVLEQQFRLRVVRLFGLEGGTRYRWYENHDELADWGANPMQADPFELLWAGLEKHGDKASSLEPTIAVLREDQPLVIHPRAPLERLGLEGESSEVVELLLLEATSFPELCSLDVAPVEVCRRVVFALLLLRFFDLGRGVLPIGVAEKGPTTLARVQLKQSAQHRLIAAAEDTSGDGERSARPRRVVDRRRDSFTDADQLEPPSEADVAAAQVLGHAKRPRTLDPESVYVPPVRPVTGGRSLPREEAPTPVPIAIAAAAASAAAAAHAAEAAAASAAGAPAGAPAPPPAEPVVAPPPAAPAAAPARASSSAAAPPEGPPPPKASPAKAAPPNEGSAKASAKPGLPRDLAPREGAVRAPPAKGSGGKVAPAKPALEPPPGGAARAAATSKPSLTAPTKAVDTPAATPAAKAAAGAAARPSRNSSRPAPRTSSPTDEPDSSVRAIRSVIEGKPIEDILSLARARIEAKDGATALELAEAALDREPQLVEARLLAITARSMRPHADLKSLALEMDEVVAKNEKLADARWYRGLLRKRLGDDGGAKREFEKALELDEAHVGAARELQGGGRGSQAPAAAKGGSLLGRLFRR
jgi:hypothetical protein